MGKKNIVNFKISQELLKSIGGIMAVELVKICEGKRKRVTDEELAKKLGMKVTEVRTVLNRLHFRGIASYNKEKNKKTGWYSYTWNIKIPRITELLAERYIAKIKNLEEKKSMEENYVFFNCKNQCENLPFEIAAEYQFRCPECGESMAPLENKTRMRQLNRKIRTLKCELGELEKYC